MVVALLPLSAVPAVAGSGPSVLPFINELHYDNTGGDTGEAVEVAGPAGTDLTGWSIVLYNGNGGAFYDTINLSGTIPDQDSGYGTLSFARAGIQNGAPDGLALVDASNTVVQFLSYEGSFTAVGGPADGMTSTDIGVSESGSGAVGNSLQLTGTGTTYDDFTWAGEATNTFGAINTGQTFGTVVNAPVVVSCGDTLYSTEGFEASRTIDASDADGTVVNIAITSTPVAGITLGDLVPAGGVGETASAVVTADSTTEPGTYAVELTATNDDPTPQTGTCTLSVTVNPILPIGTVQGSVGDTDNGMTFASPYNGDYVTIRGVVYQKLISRTSSGDDSYGFFIQNTAATADGDPNSSDGVLVYEGFYDDIYDGPSFYTVNVGDELIIRARVSEYFNLTELSSASLVSIVRTGVGLDVEVPAFAADPPNNLDDANRYWERHEGMRAQVPAGSIVLGGRDVFASTADGEVWVAAPDSPIASLYGYAKRSFRDAHVLDGVFDGNGYRIVMGSLGLKSAADDNTVLIAPVRTFDTLKNAPIGGVYFSFSKYQIQVGEQLRYRMGLPPAWNFPPQKADASREFSITTFNMENLYDYRDDPFDGCDFTGNAGCPGVDPPFDYVPESDAAYQTRLGEIASQVANDLHAPDIVMAQELEDQDICTVDSSGRRWSLQCGSTNNADGKPDTLQELTVYIHNRWHVSYDTAYDRDGADDRGIVNGFMFRTDRVELLPAADDNPVLGSDPQVVYRSTALGYNTDVSNPKSFNADLPGDVDTSTGTDGDLVFTRAPLVGYFRVWQSGIGTSAFTDLYAVDNHFSSGPDGRVGQRTEQAAYNAAIVDALQVADSNVRVVVGGDLNVYPRPDNTTIPSDQLAALYNQGMVNLYESLLAAHPASAYSYEYQGQAQTLDQLFVTPSMFSDLVEMRAAHINSDFPADYVGDGARGTSDHDPQVARFHIGVAQVEALVQYYADAGKISGNNTVKILLDRLERARTYLEAGKTAAYKAQLRAFINQVRGFTPRFVDRDASRVLTQTASLLVSSRWTLWGRPFPGWKLPSFRR